MPAIVPASAPGRGERPAPSERITGLIRVGGLNPNGAGQPKLRFFAREITFMATQANVLGQFGDAARGVSVAILCSISVAGAQTMAPLKLTVPR